MRYTALIFTLALVSCESTPERPEQPKKAAVTRTPEGEPVGLHRYREWDPDSRIVQGAQPEGDEAFRNLQALGVTMILSVDGAMPDLASASKYGLKYVHVPIGYDGVPHAQALQIIKAVESAEGRVYIHCHHGKHRGPAGAMIARIAVDGITNQVAVECLKISETSPKYAGLYRDVQDFKVPTAAEVAAAPNPPEKVVPKGVRAMMVDVSHRFEFIKKSKIEKWAVPADSPDVSPPHEARMLWELYRETARLDQAKQRGDKFLALLKQGEEAAVSLEKALRAADHAGANSAYKAVKASCNSCHAEYRN